ncbi:hypothetical protein DNTS_023969 [Danionella cerebrum]|uniref:ELM2 domain-containing protein n=1 Tax=Danionella cerebrum TaxID=2873325 RepID=A0A553MV71_9TELE|nr:hypothetical protein DNTS_023969 [Danionella translucida]TRY57082.1 hypothetical protein DNTS_023969 [Danionella translucida]
MSLSPHQGGALKSISKQNVEAISETMQHSGDLFYSVGDASLEQTHSSPECLMDSSPGIQAAFKSDKGYQVLEHFHQTEPAQWMHHDSMQTSKWLQGSQNMNKWSQNFGTIDNSRDFNKSHEAEALQEKPSTGSSQFYTETSHIGGADWDHHRMAAMHHAQFQALHQSHRSGDVQYQPQVMHHNEPDSPLQPFQVAFGPTKQLHVPCFQQVFQDNSSSLNRNYDKPKSQQQFLQLQQQQQMHRQHHLQQQMQQQQRLRQYLQQQKIQQLQQQTQGFQHLDSQAKSEMDSQDLGTPQEKADLSQTQLTVPLPLQRVSQGLGNQEPGNPAEDTLDRQETQSKHHVLPRRSRRLSKDGISPQGNLPSVDKATAQNGGDGGSSVGVIQSTQRKRRASKEINLETLAQKASEMEFLPSKYEDIATGRPAGIPPLVIPVSVPVRKGQTHVEVPISWPQQDTHRHPAEISHPDRKPSVIVARRHSLKNSAPENFNQRRPRPEPLVIPHPCNFITPSIYSSISAYQSNLRSPVRLPEHVSIIPPYTPPPILSPVREGSGLYFSTVLSSIAVGSQVLPPPPTPRNASRSLLRTSSSEVTPPAPALIGEATPVSLEPHINIGSKYQAEIPDLQDRSIAQKDQNKATLLWVPESTPSQDTRFDDLMNLVCSSVVFGGGTNPELAMHCLHECRGDVMEALEMMLMKNPIFSRNHHLTNYHYAGSDCWTVDEKRYFNKGISAYRKDFFLVQKLVRSKTVSQCVEFYYTYKKQMKVGRNGTYTYGPSDPEESLPVTHVRQMEDQNAYKQLEESPYDLEDNHHNATKTLQDNENERADMTQENPRSSSVAKGETCMPVVQSSFKTPPPVPPRPRSYNTTRRNKPTAVNKVQAEPEGIFPCKKCSRVFYKVKSRSAHMKSHAEQEKKAAAALRQREEEQAAKAQQQMMLVAVQRTVSHTREPDESSGAEESPAEADDDQDEDWK